MNPFTLLGYLSFAVCTGTLAAILVCEAFGVLGRVSGSAQGPKRPSGPLGPLNETLEGVCPECQTSMGHHVASCPVWRRWRNEALDKMPGLGEYPYWSVGGYAAHTSEPRQTSEPTTWATVEDLLGKTVDE